jgi:hypothetical protein
MLLYGAMYNELLRQATLLAFIDIFRLLAGISLFCIVGAMLLKKVTSKMPAPHP